MLRAVPYCMRHWHNGYEKIWFHTHFPVPLTDLYSASSINPRNKVLFQVTWKSCILLYSVIHALKQWQKLVILRLVHCTHCAPERSIFKAPHSMLLYLETVKFLHAHSQPFGLHALLTEPLHAVGRE